MIQRIQTVFLTIALLANLAIMVVPFWKFESTVSAEFVNGLKTATSSASSGNSNQVSDFTGNISRIILFATTVALSAFIAFVIFEYNDRKKQIKLVYIALLGNMLLIMSMVLVSIRGPFLLGASNGGNPALGFALPVIATILVWLAAKRIQKDEDLVRSVDRIR